MTLKPFLHLVLSNLSFGSICVGSDWKELSDADGLLGRQELMKEEKDGARSLFMLSPGHYSKSKEVAEFLTSTGRQR